MSRKRKAVRFSLAFLFGLPISSALAQVQTLPDTVVSATGFATPREQIGNSVTVITDEQIQRDQLRTVPDALKTVPGLNVVQSGGVGTQTSIFIRGTNSNHVKVLIDGIDVSDPSNPTNSFDFGTLNTADIERIEVLRGPQSGLYGSDAIGGVISITTKKGSGPAQWNAMAEGGSFGTFNQSMSVRGGTDNSNYAFSVSHLRSTSTPVTPLNLLAPGQKRINDFYDNMTYSGRYGVDLSDIFGLNFVGRYTDAARHFTLSDFCDPITFVCSINNNQSSSRNHEFYGNADAVWRLMDGRFNNHVGINVTDIQRHATDPDAPLGFLPVFTQFNGARTTYYWKSDFQIMQGQKLLAGVERAFDTARFNDLSGNTLRPRNGNTGAYVELHSSITDRLFVTSNFRHDENDAFGGHNTWRIAPAYLIPETGTKLKASYGTGFKAPTLFQLFSPFFPDGGNPNLKPEQSEGYDFGFEQSLLDKRLQFGVTYFHNDVKDLISFTPTPDPNNPGQTVFALENVNRAKVHGIEAFIAAQITHQFQIRADYTRTISRDLASGNELLRRPSDKTSVSAVWQPTNKWTLSATALWVSNWLDVTRLDFITKPAPSYHLINLAANYEVNDHLTVFGRIDNLLDQHYQSPIGFEHTGLAVYGGIRVKN